MAYFARSIASALALPLLLLAPTGAAADDGPPSGIDEVVVTSTRSAREPFFVPGTVYEWSADEAGASLSRTLPAALEMVPGIMVQKTGYGQGSPYIRGFTGFRTLFLIDGIRLNNSVFREGPNQYWNTVDPLSLRRVEIAKGPSSVLYGSGAVGGTVQAFTLSPPTSDDGLQTTGRAFYRYGSAERSHLGRIDGGATLPGVGLHAGFSFKRFGEVAAGQGTRRQPRTDYDEHTGDFKLEIPLDPELELTLAHQYVHQPDVWRTHKTIYGVSWEGTDVGSELKRALDQDRSLSYLRLEGTDVAGIFEQARATFSFHRQEEDQHRIRGDGRSDESGFDVKTSHVGLQLSTATEPVYWTYGVDYYHDDVQSFSRRFDANGALVSVGVQGPVADDSTYDTVGVYLQGEIDLTDSLHIVPGVRYEYARVDADKVADPATGAPFSFSESWDDVVGSVRFSWRIDEQHRARLYGGVAMAFRTPNLSDLTRFDSARSNEIETPSVDLDPEEFIEYEIGFKVRTDRLTGQLAYFYTDIDDLIVRTPTGRVIDGESEVTKRNSNGGRVQGVEASASYDLQRGFSIFGSFSWLSGEVDTFPTSAPVSRRETIDREMPVTGLLGVRWQDPAGLLWAEATASIVRRQHDLSTRDEADTQRIPPGGTPGYQVYSARAGWNVSPNLALTVALENIFNEDYRIHGSGQNETGRNFATSLEWRF